MSDLELFGSDELNQLFNEMAASQQRTVIVSAMKKAAIPFMNDVRTYSHRKGVSTSIANAVGTATIPGETGIYVGVRKVKHTKAWLANIENEGTVERYRKTKKGRVSTGHITATNFWDEALANNEDSILENVSNELIASLTRYIKRVNRKANK